ncbi:MAG: hypothetical protein ACJ76F_11205, partial [Bacteroidia bacterium]
EVYDNYEVFYVPYKSNANGRLFWKYGDNKYKYFRKCLTFMEMILQNYWNRIIPFSNIYYFSRDLLKKNKDITKMIITANPYVMFKFGYLLKKEFGLKWIADYRDDWTTDEIKSYKGFFAKIIYIFDKRSELKWVGSADHVTTVSDNYLSKIRKLLKNKNGSVIYNGFWEKENGYGNSDGSEKEFRITFNGTLYDTQPIEIFLEGIKKLILAFKEEVFIRLYFPGLAYDRSQAERVIEMMGKFGEHVMITERISRNEVLGIQAKSQLLLMIAHTNIRGVPSSKLFEYIGLRKPILVCPGDNDIIDRLVSETGLGIICNSSEEVFNKLKSCVREYLKSGKIGMEPDEEAIAVYSRAEQVKQLSLVLDKL